MNAALAARLDALLPQTQCTRCGFAGCRPYAEAIASGAADVNRCAPGGPATIGALAAAAMQAPKPLDPACGEHAPLALARIDESRCIGCVICIDACPVDAILGAPKRMHVVMAALCSGCALCVAPCPVDCITMIPAGRDWTVADASAARERFEARRERLARDERLAERGAASIADPALARRAAVASAIERARARRRRAAEPLDAP